MKHSSNAGDSAILKQVAGAVTNLATMEDDVTRSIAQVEALQDAVHSFGFMEIMEFTQKFDKDSPVRAMLNIIILNQDTIVKARTAIRDLALILDGTKKDTRAFESYPSNLGVGVGCLVSDSTTKSLIALVKSLIPTALSMQGDGSNATEAIMSGLQDQGVRGIAMIPLWYFKHKSIINKIKSPVISTASQPVSGMEGLLEYIAKPIIGAAILSPMSFIQTGIIDVALQCITRKNGRYVFDSSLLGESIYNNLLSNLNSFADANN